jgi:magnesium-transporting ATPase (P-type)
MDKTGGYNRMKNYWEQSKQELEEHLGTSGLGLNSKESMRRQEEYGLNQLQEGKKESILSIFLHQFADLLVIILLVAAGISAFSYISFPKSKHQFPAIIHYTANLTKFQVFFENFTKILFIEKFIYGFCIFT